LEKMSNSPWRAKLAAKRAAEAANKPIEDRVWQEKTDSREQRFRTAQLRAELGAIEEPPEMPAAQVAYEWGTYAELVEEVRARPDWDDYRAEISKYNAARREVYAKERAAAFRRFVDTVYPEPKKPSLPARVIGALWKGRGRE
jgi:hypothetical protein